MPILIQWSPAENGRHGPKAIGLCCQKRARPVYCILLFFYRELNFSGTPDFMRGQLQPDLDLAYLAISQINYRLLPMRTQAEISINFVTQEGSKTSPNDTQDCPESPHALDCWPNNDSDAAEYEARDGVITVKRHFLRRGNNELEKELQAFKLSCPSSAPVLCRNRGTEEHVSTPCILGRLAESNRTFQMPEEFELQETMDWYDRRIAAKNARVDSCHQAVQRLKETYTDNYNLARVRKDKRKWIQNFFGYCNRFKNSRRIHHCHTNRYSAAVTAVCARSAHASSARQNRVANHYYTTRGNSKNYRQTKQETRRQKAWSA